MQKDIKTTKLTAQEVEAIVDERIRTMEQIAECTASYGNGQKKCSQTNFFTKLLHKLSPHTSS